MSAPGEPQQEPPSPSRTRDHLANERTLLAWVRTSIAIIGLGFIVARFGLLLRDLGAMSPRPLPTGVSTVIGVALTVCGVIVLLLSLQRYRTVGKGIERDEYSWRHTWPSRRRWSSPQRGRCWRSTSSSAPEVGYDCLCAMCVARA